MMRKIDKIVIHCSATPDAMDVGFAQIDQWHLQRGWTGQSGIHCGYHYIIRRNGVIECGRMVDEIGAHVEGYNSDSVGVCLVGTHEFKEQQITSLKRIVESLRQQFPESQVYEHRQFPSAIKQGKTCPNCSVSGVLGIPLGEV